MKRGWCPSVHEPMPSGDGLLIRVKPFGGRLDAVKLCAIADVASGLGNGIVELTSRGNVQLRGLSSARVGVASAALIAAGLADADAMRERRRNVIAVPPCDDALVARIETVLVDIENLAAKFCVSVGDADADIVVRDGFVCAGDDRIACSDDDVPGVVGDLARAAGGKRIAAVHTLSPPGKGALPSPGPSHNGRRETCELTTLEGGAGCGTAAFRPANNAGDQFHKAATVFERADGSFKHGRDEGKRGCRLLHLPYGQTNATALRGLARLIGPAEVRTTPWRAFQSAGHIDPAALGALGFITDRADLRRFIAACPGAPACASASVATRADAGFLASLGIGNVHVSGCAKGCAHHRPATTLTGSNGRYDLIRHGFAHDAPDATGLTIAEVAAALA